MSLWLWRRRADVTELWQPSPIGLGLYALLAAGIVVALEAFVVQWSILQQNPGLTYFVARALIAIPFFFWLASYVALDGVGLLAGSLLLPLVWTTYGMYLGPTGLPSEPIRYPGYATLWLFSFPAQVMAVLMGSWFAAAIMQIDRPRRTDGYRTEEGLERDRLRQVA